MLHLMQCTFISSNGQQATWYLRDQVTCGGYSLPVSLVDAAGNARVCIWSLGFSSQDFDLASQADCMFMRSLTGIT